MGNRSSGLALRFNMSEGLGATLRDLSPYKTDGTITGAEWARNAATKKWGLDFDSAIPDLVTVAAPQCNFTTQNFSIVARIKADIIGGSGAYICSRGLFSTDGWDFFLLANKLYYQTHQVAANQSTLSSANSIVLATTYTVGLSVTSLGTAASLYIDGNNDGTGAHTVPVTSNRSLYIGTYGDGASYPFDGIINALYIFNRALNPLEHEAWHDLLNG